MNATTTNDGSSFRPWHLFAVLTMLSATAAVFTVGDTSPTNLVMVSLAIMSAGWAGFMVFRTLWPLAAEDGDTHQPIVAGKARLMLEREKQLVMRSIKELEFDKAMGKVAQQDFDEMVGRLRGRAVGLMKQLDVHEPHYRTQIERELARRLGTPAGDAARPAATAAPAAASVAPVGAATVAAVTCPSCETGNEADARFCKHCGTKLTA